MNNLIIIIIKYLSIYLSVLFVFLVFFKSHTMREDI